MWPGRPYHHSHSIAHFQKTGRCGDAAQQSGAQSRRHYTIFFPFHSASSFSRPGGLPGHFVPKLPSLDALEHQRGSSKGNAHTCTMSTISSFSRRLLVFLFPALSAGLLVADFDCLDLFHLSHDFLRSC